ncbi:hypothetical protein SLE2022_323910 [Rubroshorea leprosula]
MLNPFTCGTCGFHHQEEDGEPSSCSVSTPKKSKRSNLDKSHNSNSKNPYSSCGLDKFSALLAELEEKREKIYSQMGSQDISFVCFVYKNSNDCVPVVVRSKEKREKEKLGETKAKSPRPVARTQQSEILDEFPTTAAGGNRVKLVKIDSDLKKEKNSSWITKLRRWRRPSYYFPAVIVMILLLLVFFGRLAVTLCTCLFWCMIHTLKRDGSNVRRVTKKKDYVRKLSENKLVGDGFSSPTDNKAGAVRDKSSKRAGHRHSR